MRPEPATVAAAEGSVTVQLPAAGRRPAGAKGPATHEGGPFYNPAMRFARDLTVLVVEARAAEHTHDKPFEVYDGLAASGIRGLRIAKEAKPPPNTQLHVHLNDRDPAANELLVSNIHANGLDDRCRATCADFALAPAGHRYHHVDVDPFGSPAPFLDAAIRALRPGGTLALTATDTTALCGVYPDVCRRRYDAKPWHGPSMHETALRILAGAAVRHAARFDVALRPILSHATDHYVRVFLASKSGAQRADQALRGIGHAVEEKDGTRRIIAGHEAPSAAFVRLAGPLWTGSLHDAGLLAAVTAALPDHPDVEVGPLQRFLALAANEVDAPPLCHEVGEWGKRLGQSVPPLPRLLAALRAAGHAATRTHTAPAAFKTDAPGPAVGRIFSALVQKPGGAPGTEDPAGPSTPR